MSKNRRNHFKDKILSPHILSVKTGTSDFKPQKNRGNLSFCVPKDVMDSGIQEDYCNSDAPNDLTQETGLSGTSYCLTESNLKLFNALQERRKPSDTSSVNLSRIYEKRNHSYGDYDHQFKNLLSACSELSHSGIFNDMEKEYLAVSVYQTFKRIVNSCLFSNESTYFEGKFSKKSFLVKAWLQKQYELGLFRENVMDDLFKMDPFYSGHCNSLPEYPSSSNKLRQPSSLILANPKYDTSFHKQANLNIQNNTLSSGDHNFQVFERIDRVSIYEVDESINSDASEEDNVSQPNCMNSDSTLDDMTFRKSKKFQGPSACSSMFGGTPYFFGKSTYSPCIFQSDSTLSPVQPVSSTSINSSKINSKKNSKVKQVTTDSNSQDENCFNKTPRLNKLKSQVKLSRASTQFTPKPSKRNNKRKRKEVVQLQNNVVDNLTNTKLDKNISSFGRKLKSPSPYWSSKH